MKQRTRTAAAVVTTSLLAGGGLAAAVTGLSQPAPAAVQDNGARSADQETQEAALSAALQELLVRNRGVHHQLAVARQELHRLDGRLDHERAVAVRVAAERQRAARLEAAARTAPPAGLHSPSPTAASVHTTTRASGGSHASPPATHVTTRASGAVPRTGRPTVHATTRASGARGHGHGHDDGGHEGGGHDD